MENELHECIRCKEITDTDLQLENGMFICEDCVMIVGELAEMDEK